MSHVIPLILENKVGVEVEYWWFMESGWAFCRGVVALTSHPDADGFSRVEFRMRGEDMRKMLGKMNHILMWCCESGYLEEQTRGPLRCTSKLAGNWIYDDGGEGSGWKCFDKAKDEWMQRDPWEEA